MGPDGPHSELERTWTDDIARERKLLREHGEWTIARLKPDNWPAGPVVFEASDGVVTLRSQVLGRLLDMVENAMREGT